MKKTIFVLGLTAILMATLTVVPGARAVLQPQDGDHLDDPNAPLAVSDNPDVAMVHSNYGPGGREQYAIDTAAYWTQERMDEALPAPAPDFGASEGPLTEPLVQANGAASFMNGMNAAGVESATVNAGTLSGASTQIPSLTYPFPFTRTGMNIPPAVRTFGKMYYTTWNAVNYYTNATVITSGAVNYDMTVLDAYSIHPGDNNPAHWSNTFLFCPQTAYGVNPYGCWADDDIWVPTAWYTSGNPRYNYGFVDTYDGQPPGSHTAGNLSSIVGAQGIAWNQPSFQSFWHVGYPYSGYAPAGQVVYFCTATLARLDSPSGSGPQPLGIGCDMPDTWGGAYMINGKVANKGFVNSVATYKKNSGDMYGPYFDSTFKAVWDLATAE